MTEIKQYKSTYPATKLVSDTRWEREHFDYHINQCYAEKIVCSFCGKAIVSYGMGIPDPEWTKAFIQCENCGEIECLEVVETVSGRDIITFALNDPEISES
jgi:hypothetical protein